MVLLMIFSNGAHAVGGSRCEAVFEEEPTLISWFSETFSDFFGGAPEKYPTIEMRGTTREGDLSGHVLYIPAQILPRYEVHFDPLTQTWGYDQNLPLVDGAYFYHMTGDGRLYALRMDDEDPRVRLQHSSLPAGGKTAGVGFMSFKDRRLRSIDRCSGHYKPTMEIFQNVLGELHERGQQMTSVQIGVQC